MAKTKSAEEKLQASAEGIGSAIKTGTDTVKASFDKAVKGYDQLVEYGKENVAAVSKSASAASKGVEVLHNEIYTYTKSSVEGSFEQAKALLGTKSIQEAIELQTDFAKASFDTYISQLTKLGDLFASASKEAFEPLQGRVSALVEAAQSARAI